MNEREYRAALRAGSALVDLDPELTSPLGRVLDDIVHLIEDYERVHFQFEKPTDAELAKFRAEEQARTD